MPAGSSLVMPAITAIKSIENCRAEDRPIWKCFRTGNLRPLPCRELLQCKSSHLLHEPCDPVATRIVGARKRATLSPDNDAGLSCKRA
jgi:hypothetical protein